VCGIVWTIGIRVVVVRSQVTQRGFVFFGFLITECCQVITESQRRGGNSGTFELLRFRVFVVARCGSPGTEGAIVIKIHDVIPKEVCLYEFV
jgi:hypothetical protein